MSTFFEQHLNEKIHKTLTSIGFSAPTQIQEQAIPEIIRGKDLMAAAKTGTGKTAAYLLPIFHKILAFANTSPSPARHPIRVLILAPTRELVEQIYQESKRFMGEIPFKTLAVYGGTDVSPQRQVLQKGIDLLVATPGRLLDHLELMPQMLNQLSILVLDEADRMLDMGFMPDIQKIASFLPQKRQTLLFSATFAEEIKKLGLTLLSDPIHIQVHSPNSTVDQITQIGFSCSAHQKDAALLRLIQNKNIFPAIIFTNTKHECARFARYLAEQSVKADSIHGDKSQSERDRALAKLKQKEIDILVATDVAARGLDIQGLPMVINLQIPFNPEDYVHRIGRTGRANQTGLAYSFVASQEQELWAHIQRFVQKDIPLIPTTKLFGISAETDKIWFYQPYIPEIGDTPGVATDSPKSVGSAKQSSRLRQSPALFDRKLGPQIRNTRKNPQSRI